MPYPVLLIRGAVRIDTVEGIAPEYALTAVRYLREDGGETWLGQATALSPQMTRLFVRPDRVGVLDFQTRFPSAVERAIARVKVVDDGDRGAPD
jgi:hypothetical protein